MAASRPPNTASRSRHAATTVPAGSGFTWRSITGPGLDALPQPAVDDLRLRFTTVGGGDSNVRAAYATAAGATCP